MPQTKSVINTELNERERKSLYDLVDHPGWESLKKDLLLYRLCLLEDLAAGTEAQTAEQFEPADMIRGRIRSVEWMLAYDEIVRDDAKFENSKTEETNDDAD